MKTIIILLFTAGLFNFTSFLNAQSKPEENQLLINSYPEGASVFINGANCGKTPYTHTNIESDTTKVKVTLNGITREQTAQLIMGKMEMFFVMDGEYGILNINTFPESAQVIIDDTLKSAAPLLNEKISNGLHRIKIINSKYDIIERTVFIKPVKYDYNFQLERKYSRLLPEDENIAELKIDGFETERESSLVGAASEGYTILKGKRKIELTASGYSRMVSGEFDIEGGYIYKLKARYNYFTPKYVLLSAALPGLGQILDKSVLKGAAYMAGTAALALLYLKADDDYKYRLPDYDKNIEEYRKAFFEGTALNARLKLEETVNDLNNAQKRKVLFISAAAGVYLLSLIDAVIFHTSGSHLEMNKVDAAPAGNGLGLRININ